MYKLDIRTGTEGPWQDPYSYEECLFQKNDLKVVLHFGLGEWIDINGERTLRKVFDVRDHLCDISIKFEEVTGLSYSSFRRAYNRINYPKRCKKCYSKKTEIQQGYPGETFEVCTKCGEHRTYYFDESAVM